MSLYCKSSLEELEKLLTNGFEYLEQICHDTPAYTGEGKTIARLLLDFFQQDGKKMLYVVLWATTREIENTKSEDIVFRESNVQTELMFGYFYVRRGMQYLITLLSPLILSIHKHAQVVESTNDKRYYEGMIDHLQCFVDRFTVLDAVPQEFQRVFRHMKKEMNNRFPTSEHQFIVLSLLFLRIICPAIITPSLLKMDLVITPHTQKALVCCARVLQNLANFSSFEDAPMNVFDDFLSSNRERVKEFFLKLTMETNDSRILAPPPPPPTKKKRLPDKSVALYAIMQQLQGSCLEKLGKNSRVTMAANETKQFILLLTHPKWKLYRKRSDAETYIRKNRENCYSACKLTATVRASVGKIFEYFRQYERCVYLWPNLVKSKIIKIHDESHVDMVAQYKGGFPFYGVREYYFSRCDRMSDDSQTATVVGYAIDQKTEINEEGIKRAAFKTSGLMIQQMDDNPGWSWLHVVVSLDRKLYGLFDNPNDLDALQYSFLETVRRDCE